MKIYQITENVERFQSFSWVLKDGTALIDGTPLNETIMDCAKKGENWIVPTIEIDDYGKHLPKPDICGIGADSLIFSEKAYLETLQYIEKAGEIFNFTYQNENYFLLNITNCGQYLDMKKTEFVIGKRSKLPIRISQYFFDTLKVENLDLFKIDFNRARKFVLEDSTRLNFKSTYEKSNLTGLIFELVWDSDDNGSPNS